MNKLASFETECATRYLTALCHHFGRKVDTGCNGNTGWVQFPFGRCDLRASDHRLDLVAAADCGRQLDQVVQIMTSHLERFAFRENPRLDWKDGAASPAQS